MRSIDHSFLLKLKSDYKNYNTFIETGTFQGDTTFAMEPYFQNLITIEVKEELHKSVVSKYEGDKIKFIHGDSVEVFKYLFKYVHDKSIFFLDGHYSSGITGYNNKTVPLIDEIELINKNFKNEGIIIIDDVRLFGKMLGSEDWSEISKDKILEILFDRISDFYYMESELDKQDRLVIHIKSSFKDCILP